MLDAKNLSRFLFIADMSIGCEVCSQNTWTADANMSDEDIYVKQLWHSDDCPLKNRKDVYDLFSSCKEIITPYSGKIFLEQLKLGTRNAHSIWLATLDKKYRIVAAHEHFGQLDLTRLDGKHVSILGTVHSDTIYTCMIIAEEETV